MTSAGKAIRPNVNRFTWRTKGVCYIWAAPAFIGCVVSEVSAESDGRTLDETFLDVYDQEAATILAYVRAAVGDDSEAEDLAAESFLRAWREWPRFRRSERPVRHWLIRIAHNLVIDRARRRARLRLVPIGDETSDGRDTGSTVADRLQMVAALQHLSPDDLHVIALRAAGLQFAEVAAVLGKTEPAARMAWHRAARKLRTELER